MYTSIRIYIYIYIYICIYVYINVCIYICVYENVHIPMYTCMYICICTHIHKYINIDIYTYTHTYTREYGPLATPPFPRFSLSLGSPFSLSPSLSLSISLCPTHHAFERLGECLMLLTCLDDGARLTVQRQRREQCD